MNTKPRIALLGDLTADVYMPQKDIHLGGAALNMAKWVKTSGGIPVIFSAVGSDAIGKKFLREESIQIKRGRTSTIDIFVSQTGERRYGSWEPGVFAYYHLRKKDTHLIAQSDATVVTVYPPHLHVLDELPFSTWTVINWGEFHHDIAFIEQYMKRAEAMVFGLDKDADEERIQKIRQLAIIYKKLMIVTLGQYGSVAWYDGQSYVQPAREVNVVDTTGAGDAFLAALLVSYLKTKDVQKSLEAGCNVAAQVIQIVGAY